MFPGRVRFLVPSLSGKYIILDMQCKTFLWKERLEKLENFSTNDLLKNNIL